MACISSARSFASSLGCASSSYTAAVRVYAARSHRQAGQSVSLTSNRMGHMLVGPATYARSLTRCSFTSKHNQLRFSCQARVSLIFFWQ